MGRWVLLLCALVLIGMGTGCMTTMVRDALVPAAVVVGPTDLVDMAVDDCGRTHAIVSTEEGGFRHLAQPFPGSNQLLDAEQPFPRWTEAPVSWLSADGVHGVVPLQQSEAQAPVKPYLLVNHQGHPEIWQLAELGWEYGDGVRTPTGDRFASPRFRIATDRRHDTSANLYFLGLLPFTAVFDLLTCPVQLVVIGCELMD